MLESAAARPDRAELAGALADLAEGVVLFDADWTIRYVNPAGARLLGRPEEDLTGSSIWVGLPELGGTIFHSFLLHARSVGGRVSWQGFYSPTGRWLAATAVRTQVGLELYFRETRGHDGGELPEPRGGDDLAEAEDAGRDRLRFLAEVSEGLISTLDTGKAAATLARLVTQRLCDWAVVMVMGEQGRPADEAWAHRDPQLQGALDTYMRGRVRGSGGDTPLLRALLTGEPVQIAPFDEAAVQATLGTDEVRAAWARLDAGSCTVVPLRARSETFGALVMVNGAARPPHGEMQIATAVEVARRGSLALDNARLYGRQLTVAETFQHSLLTPPPQPDDLEITVRYQPATTHMHVGGDWYDSFQQPDGATLLVIGDVVGHNVDAAAAMGQIRSLLRGIAYDRAGSPAETLDRVDQVIGGLRIGSMATALLARVEQPEELARVGRRLLRWSSAGHLPPLLLPAGGGVRVLATPAERLLGTGVAGVRTDHEQVLHPGDTVVFYTDGIVEHGRSGIDEGIARLAGAVEALRDVPGEVLLDRLLARLVPERTDDDIAVLTLRVHPQGR